MNDKPRQVLCDLLRKQGVSLSQDRARCSGLLRDHCGAFKAETMVLLAAMEEGVPARLTEQSGNFAPEILIGYLIKRMRIDRQLTEEAARWAVESWALALGISFSAGAPSGDGASTGNRSQNRGGATNHSHSMGGDTNRNSAGAAIFCSNCGSKNLPGAKFCSICGLATSADLQPEPHLQSGAGQQYAGFWMRVLAGFIDVLLGQLFILIVAVISGGILGGVMGAASASMESIKEAATALGQFISVVISWLWFTVAESSAWQASVGKKMLGLKVTDEEGGRISFGRANRRYWSKILSALILMAGFLMVPFTEKRQGLHDKIAGTLVVKAL